MKRIVALGLIALTGCAATPLRTDATNVRVTNAEPGPECKFLGDITGNQGNWLSGGLTSNETLETGARNDLKNQAAAMGGNLVVLLTQRAGQSGHGNFGGAQTNVALSGNVYRCP